MSIRWPEQRRPDHSAVHISNSLTVALPREVLWAWIIRANDWPDWYRNSSDVVITEGSGPNLQMGTKFRWKTFGVAIESVVEEFVPCQRLAWSARGTGVDAYHAWLFEPTHGGCNILTEETQNGFMARLGSIVMPTRMHKYHQIWLESLRVQALTGPPRN
jgi:hypothetical protein